MLQGTPVSRPTLSNSFSDDKIRFVWVTDSHVKDTKTIQKINLRLAISDCNNWKPNAFIHTGDIGHNSWVSVKSAFHTMSFCNYPVYTAIGNHDEVEVPIGTPNTPALMTNQAFHRNPLNWTNTMSPGDGSYVFRCVYLDCNYYSDDTDEEGTPGNSPYHSTGDRIGHFAAEPNGGYRKMLTASQLQWMTGVLAGDTTADAVIVFMHYPPNEWLVDYKGIADVLQADGRSTILFCGHNHPHAAVYTTLVSTDTLATYTCYKCPAMEESGCWTRVTLSFNGSAIVVDELLVKNYTDPGGWVINSPFTT